MNQHDIGVGAYPKKKLSITRTLEAPRDLVFKVWTNPMHLAQWWGPTGFTNPVCQADVQPGGRIYIEMQGPDGSVYPMAGLFHEVNTPSRLSFTASALDARGDVDLEVLINVTFEDVKGKTRLTLDATAIKVTPNGEQHLAGMETGWIQSLDRLTNRLTLGESLNRELVITRLFNAPRELVFDVWTHPDHLKNWWGPNGFTTTIHKMDVRAGGAWEFILHGPDGTDYKNKSVFTEVKRPERIVYDHISGPKFRSEITFDAQGSKTLLTMRMLFDSAEDLEKTIKTFGADEGLKQNMERLKIYLEEMKSN